MEMDLGKIKNFLKLKLLKNESDVALSWLEERLAEMKKNYNPKTFILNFSAAYRYFSKSPIQFLEIEMKEAENLRKGWSPHGLKGFEIARILIYLHLPIQSKQEYFETVNKLFKIGDIGELVLLYKSLCIFPYSQEYISIALEGIRSSIKDVFDAIALSNPYPSENLSEEQWNQMVLKAVFNGSPLYKIIGLDARANATLSQQLSNYAHERWAASRQVNPELWRAASSFTNDALLSDYKKLLSSTDDFEKEAAALSCYYSKNEDALKLIQSHEVFFQKVSNGHLHWQEFSERWYGSKNP